MVPPAQDGSFRAFPNTFSHITSYQPANGPPADFHCAKSPIFIYYFAYLDSFTPQSPIIARTNPKTNKGYADKAFYDILDDFLFAFCSNFEV